MPIVKIWPFLFLLFLSQTLYAAELAPIIRALETPFKTEAKTSQKISDFHLNFIQDSEVTSLGQKQRARGEAVFQFMPATEKGPPTPLFRWHYQEPDEQLIVCDGRDIWLYVPDNQQVIRSKADEALAQQGGTNPLIFLTNLGELQSYFDIGWAAEHTSAQDPYLLKLTPREQTPLVRSIVLAVPNDIGKESFSGFPIKALLLTNVNEDKTFIRITDARVNQKPDASLFRFTPPPDVEILTPEDLQQAF